MQDPESGQVGRHRLTRSAGHRGGSDAALRNRLTRVSPDRLVPFFERKTGLPTFNFAFHNGRIIDERLSQAFPKSLIASKQKWDLAVARLGQHVGVEIADSPLRTLTVLPPAPWSVTLGLSTKESA